MDITYSDFLSVCLYVSMSLSLSLSPPTPPPPPPPPSPPLYLFFPLPQILSFLMTILSDFTNFYQFQNIFIKTNCKIFNTNNGVIFDVLSANL